MDFRDFVRSPKAELHVHLEGSLLPSRVVELAERYPLNSFHNMDEEKARRLVRPSRARRRWIELLTRLGLHGIAARIRRSEFVRFQNTFVAAAYLLQSRDAFQKATEDLLACWERQGVTRGQVLYSPTLQMDRMGVELEVIHAGIEAGLRCFPRLPVRFVLDLLMTERRHEILASQLQKVLADRKEWLGGFSLGGGARGVDMGNFVPIFAEAAEAGLFCVAHSGELDSPRNIEILLRDTPVQRIAHACRAIESPEILALMKKRQVTVDACPSSNLCTFVVPHLRSHPLQVFIREGIPFTINTDDPFHFDTDLYREYQIALEIPGVGPSDLAASMKTSLRAFDHSPVSGGPSSWREEAPEKHC